MYALEDCGSFVALVRVLSVAICVFGVVVIGVSVVPVGDEGIVCFACPGVHEVDEACAFVDGWERTFVSGIVFPDLGNFYAGVFEVGDCLGSATYECYSQLCTRVTCGEDQFTRCGEYFFSLDVGRFRVRD